MALWHPSAVEGIGNAEHLGRRRFKRPQLVGAAGQPLHPLDYRDFFEQRDRNVSVDRLGKTGIDRKVQLRVCPLAEAHGRKQKPEKEFLGWACIQAGKFLKEAAKLGYSVMPDPITGMGTEDNEYHGYISYPDGTEPFHAALYLREMFYQHGQILIKDVESNPKPPAPTTILGRFLSLIGIRKASNL